MSLISASEIAFVFRDCLFRKGEDTSKAILVEGITLKPGFHPERLESYRKQVKTWLKDLPKEFHKDSGGGWSFLNAPLDRNMEQWGEQSNAQELMCLGAALGYVTSSLPRELWAVLPGGVPYYEIDLNKEVQSNT